MTTRRPQGRKCDCTAARSVHEKANVPIKWTQSTRVVRTRVLMMFVQLFDYAYFCSTDFFVMLRRKLEKIRPKCVISQLTRTKQQNVARNPQIPFSCLFWPYFYIYHFRFSSKLFIQGDQDTWMCVGGRVISEFPAPEQLYWKSLEIRKFCRQK